MISDCSLWAQKKKKKLSTFKILHTMSDYGYDFSFYLLSQLSEKTSVSSEVTWYHHSRLVVLAMAHKFWISILCRVSLPHSSLEAPRVAHICSQISAFLLCDCVIILQGQAVWWEPPHLLIPLSPRHWVQHPPSAGNSLLEQHQHLWRAPVSPGVPEVFKWQRTSAKWRGMNFLWLLSCRRTQ